MAHGPGRAGATFWPATLPAVALLALFFAVPLGAIFVDAFTGGGAAFGRVLAAPRFASALFGSAILTVVATGFSMAVGLAVAVHLARLPDARRTALAFAIALPLTFSGLIVAYGFILAYGRAGFVTQLLAMMGGDAAVIGKALFTPVGLAFASSYYLIPRVVMSLLPVLVNVEQAQLDAAESLGATPREAFLHVVLPAIAGPAIGTACLIAAVIFGAYGTALALVGTGVDLLPLQLYTMVSDTGSDFPAAAALALLITASCSIVLVAGELAAARHERHLDG
ncbi:MAG: ABC transporter permease subunit [Betaproteobacteria bacterium]